MLRPDKTDCMNTLDIILLIPLVYAVYKGFRDGVIVQLGGIIGIIIGVWLAFRFCDRLGVWMGIDPDIASYVAFAIIVLGAIISIGLIGWLLGKVFNMVGLGLFNGIGGVILALIKMTLILSVLMMAFNAINRKTEIVSPRHFDNSALYKPISRVSDYIFPYLDFVKDKIVGDSTQTNEENE